MNRLARKGLLVRDEAVVAALQDRPVDLSPRTVERRVLRATGLTRRAMKAIERAGTAADLLDGGATILDAVARAGYADQSHLTERCGGSWDRRPLRSYARRTEDLSKSWLSRDRENSIGRCRLGSRQIVRALIQSVLPNAT